MKKYIAYGGTVLSMSDGDIHSLTPERVAELYEVAPAECIMVHDGDDLKGYTFDFLQSLTVLRPDGSGQYQLKTEGNSDEDRT